MILMACYWLSAYINSSSKRHRMSDFLLNGIHGWFYEFIPVLRSLPQFKSAFTGIRPLHLRSLSILRAGRM
jgi:hypothetical protein